MKHVIIGNGPAGVVAAEALRRNDPQADITLIGDEPEAPYSRMAIPYFLTGSIPDQGTHLRKAGDHYERHGIHLRQGRVIRVEPESQTVILEDDTELGYDRLLVASGCYPVRPPIRGIDLPGVHTCWTLADARAIADKAGPGSRVLQIGAGFIGCIIMEALVSRGVRLTIVETGDRMVPRMMTPKAGAMIARWVAQKGVNVNVGSAVTEIATQGDALVATLSNGKAIEADVVICAAGVRPNVGFLAGSGIAVGHGVHVDEFMRTGVKNIFAAGDVTEASGFHTGERELNAIQPAAADQARVAAVNMTGGEARFHGALAINVLDTLGLISTSFGQWWGADGGEGVEQVDEENFRYLSLQFKDDVMVGATSIGWTDHVGSLRGLVQGRMRLGPWKDKLMKDPTQFMTAYLSQTHKVA
ncbi:MAG: NAD(P)/FAD-dependent oxidoreductase [Rhodocyclaceae bacterium]|nr:NAD(P)/FAD-dependent oxidoreductase [Rhodocyclaceae bacterium]